MTNHRDAVLTFLCSLAVLSSGTLFPRAAAAAGEEDRGREIVAAALRAIDAHDFRLNLRSLSVRADCRAAGGPFVFEVDTLPPDHLAWRRVDGRGIREVVVAGDLAWSVDAGTGRASPAAAESVAAARLHDVMGLVLELDRLREPRFVGRRAVKDSDGNDTTCLGVRLVMAGGLPVEICFDETSSLPLTLGTAELDEPGSTALRLRITSWMPSNNGQLPESFSLGQGEDVATCRYELVRVNQVRRGMFAAPPELGVSTSPDEAEEFDCEAVEQISASECRALVALFTATGGAHWQSQSLPGEPWLRSPRPCDWGGVACEDADGGSRLIGLDLGSRRLSGALPVELAGLIHLRWLRLGASELTGQIPAAIGQLRDLVELTLSNGRLSGGIPAELGKLTALEVLSLANNDLTGPIPPFLARLPRLRELALSQNRLTGEIPPALVASPSLEHLSLWENELRGTLPVEVGPRLESFSFWNNPLYGPIPETYRRFRLEGNRLSGTLLCVPRSLEDVVVNRRFLEHRRWPCLETAEKAAAWEREQEAALPHYAVLERPVELLVPRVFYSLSGPIHYPGGERDSLPYPEEVPAGSLVRRTAEGLTLLDGVRLASGRPELAAFTHDTSFEEARRRLTRALDDVVVLGVLDDERVGDYVLTLLDNGDFVDYGSAYGFEFLHELLVAKGEWIELYQDGRHVGRARVAKSVEPPSAGGPRLEVDEIEALEPYSHGRPLLYTLRPLPVTGALETPDFSELLARPKAFRNGWIDQSYVLAGRIDLDGDGVAELLFRELGSIGTHFTLFRHIEGRWQLVYRGGGWSGC